MAVISGIGVVLVAGNVDTFGAFGSLKMYGLSGLVFAAGVLFPYLKTSNKKLLRATGLVLASAISFRCAAWIALPNQVLPFEYESISGNWISFTAASVAGAAIVMLATRVIVPIRSSLAFVLLGLFAGFLGGPLTSVTLPTANSAMFVGYATWHTLICLAIYFGTPSTIAGAKFSAWLTHKTRGTG
jgi:hypothetical protein